MGKYKYILFDADNTLFDFDLAERDALRDTMLMNGISLTEDDFGVYHRINDGLWKKLERGEIDRERLKVRRFEEFAAYLSLDASVSPSDLARDFVGSLSKQSQLLPEAESVCERLSDKYRLSIVTNGILSVQRSRFYSSAIAKYFTDLFISEEIGATKPDVRFFNTVKNKIGDADLSNYIVIGDSLTSDIQGAVNFGCDSIWISPEGKFDSRPTYTVTKLSQIFEILE